MEAKSFLFEQLVAFKQISTALTESGSSQSDMQDIINSVIDIFNEFVFDKDNNYLEIDVFCQNEFKKRHREVFLRGQKMMDPILTKLNILNDQMKDIKTKYKEYLEESTAKRKKLTIEYDSKNKDEMDLFNMKLEEEIKEKKDLVALVYENFDKYLAERLGELSRSYQEKITKIEDDSTKIQLELQTIIHEKHSIKQNILVKFDSVDRQFALSHEKLSREYNEKRNSLTVQKKELQESIDETRDDIERSAGHSDAKMYKMEDEYKIKQDKLLQEKKDKISELESEENELNIRINKLNLEKEQVELENQAELTAIRQKLNERLKKEKSIIDEKIRAIEKEIFKTFQPKIKEIDESITQCVQNKDSLDVKLRKAAYNQNQKSYNSLIAIQKIQENEINELKETIRQKKKELGDLIHQKNEDLKDYKHQIQKQVGNVMQNIDTKAQGNMLEIVDIMKSFDDQQRILTELHERSIQDRNTKRMQMIAQIKKEHEERKNSIIKKFDEMKNKQVDATFQKEKIDEDKKHSEDIKNLEDRINRSKSKMQILQMKIEGFLKINNERIQSMKKEMPQFFDNDKEKTPLKPAEVVDELEKRKEVVQKEASEAKQNLDNLKSTFDIRMRRIEENYLRTKKQFYHEEKQADTRVDQLSKLVDEQESKLKELTVLANVKTEEADKFEETYEDQKNEFEEKTRETFQVSLDNVKQPTIDFQNEMEELKATLGESVKRLQEQLDEAKANTEKTMNAMLEERQRRLEQLQNEMKMNHLDKIEEMKRKHENRLSEIDNELINKKQYAIDEKVRIEENYKMTLEKNEIEFQETMESLDIEKNELNEETKILNNRIDEEKRKVCPNCVNTKRTIHAMLVKREMLAKKLGILTDELLKNEIIMNEIFQPPPRITLQPPIIVSKSTANSPAIKTRKSPLNLTMPQRPATAIGLEKLKLSSRRPKTSTYTPLCHQRRRM
ncbi:hypothetical protein TRFO_40104 [Tritrichomonas foetus]|uniref:Uncharacterized protein n=1 Tax=Tritrichomonas foetus TaxID=1144522 RepID=A0A1J4J877_9EUKA|nr:hypothetical protein TRFO_40104 [Tritrichomonas foetus]|eukprot:OHS93613.1 hypothetical protein TRFO_40104 [Tritrichomonas foetus]